LIPVVISKLILLNQVIVPVFQLLLPDQLAMAVAGVVLDPVVLDLAEPDFRRQELFCKAPVFTGAFFLY